MYGVTGAQMLFLLEHVKALEKRVVVFSRFFGPGEALWFMSDLVFFSLAPSTGELILAAIAVMVLRAFGIALFPPAFVASHLFERIVQGGLEHVAFLPRFISLFNSRLLRCLPVRVFPLLDAAREV
jgi:hypothetical protein